MEIIRTAETRPLEANLEITQGERYLVLAVHFFHPHDVRFQLVGYSVGDSAVHYLFPADLFSSVDGKQPHIMRAKSGTKAYARSKDDPLYLSGIVVVNRVECVLCHNPGRHATYSKPLPYDEFTHL